MPRIHCVEEERFDSGDCEKVVEVKVRVEEDERKVVSVRKRDGAMVESRSRDGWMVGISI